MEDRDEQFKNMFADLIHQRLGLYRSISVKIVNSAADADDAVQAALLKAWSRRKSFQSNPAALSGWISRIVVTESYDLLRKRMREERNRANLPDADNTSDKQALEKLDRAIAALPKLYRETVHLALLSGLKSDEAAQQLECSPNTLYQRIHQAKKMLREWMRRPEHD